MGVDPAPVVSRKLLVDQATSVLRGELLSGALPPGSRVNLAETAHRLGMSTIPVREALRTLSTEGLVIALPLRGFHVPDVTYDDLEDTYRLRLVLDPMAVELGVPRLTPEQIGQLERVLGGLEAALHAEDPVGIRDTNREFHFVIYEASESPWLVRMISMLWENTERYHRLGGVGSLGTPEERTAEHASIFEACRDGDAAGAAARMAQHLTRTHGVARQALTDDSGSGSPAPAKRRSSPASPRARAPRAPGRRPPPRDRRS